MLLLNNLKGINNTFTCRFVSNKFFKPHPRSYKRRLFEAALKPILSSEILEQKKLLTENEVYSFLPKPNECEVSFIFF